MPRNKRALGHCYEDVCLHERKSRSASPELSAFLGKPGAVPRLNIESVIGKG